MRAMIERRYFGTDGVRGVAGRQPMTAEFALRLGAATAAHLRARGIERPQVAIGMDTRRSGPMLAHAVAAGLASRGADVIWLGVMPTPGVAFLTRTLGADAGIVVSASHNPFTDNGIKLFGGDASKLDDAEEAAIEARLDDDDTGAGALAGADIGGSRRYALQQGDYLGHLLANAPYLDGLRVGLDCANGAASDFAPKVFRKIGARLDVIHAAPNGVNINVDSGSTHPDAIVTRVLEHGLDVGVTFDGDADRALLVDPKGRIVTGDHIVAICAQVRGIPAVVGTVMTNLGIERYLIERGIDMHRTPVGDRYVVEKLRSEGLTLGGEASGHVLFLDRAPTGDGILTALQLLAAVRASGRTLLSWMDEIPVFPQVLRNVAVAAETKHELAEHGTVTAAVEAAEASLGDEGRILVRASGTEPLVRVMVEGADADRISSVAADLVGAVESAAAATAG